MKVQTINGVPYFINESNQVFFYDKSKTTQTSIGHWDPARQHLELAANWQEIVRESVIKYREQLNEHTQAEMTKARELQKV
jgi:hypothetical protein